MVAGRTRKRHAGRWSVIATITATTLALLVALAGCSPKILSASRSSGAGSPDSGAAGSHPGTAAGSLPAKGDPVPSARPSGKASGDPSPGASTKGQPPSAANTGGSSGSGGSGGTASGGGGSGSSGSPSGGIQDPCMVGTWLVNGYTLKVGGFWYTGDENGLGFGVTSNTYTKTINANGSFTENYISLYLTYSNTNPGNGGNITISGTLSGSMSTTADANGQEGQEGQVVATYGSGEVTTSNGTNVNASMTGDAGFNCNGNLMWEDFPGENELMTRVTS